MLQCSLSPQASSIELPFPSSCFHFLLHFELLFLTLELSSSFFSSLEFTIFKLKLSLYSNRQTLPFKCNYQIQLKPYSHSKIHYAHIVAYYWITGITVIFNFFQQLMFACILACGKGKHMTNLEELLLCISNRTYLCIK